MKTDSSAIGKPCKRDTIPIFFVHNPTSCISAEKIAEAIISDFLKNEEIQQNCS